MEPETSPTETAPPITDAGEGPDDRTLVARARMGSESAFEDLVRRYQTRIYGLCYHLTANHEDSGDLTQEAFVKAWKALRSFKGDSSFYTWLYRIAYNNVLNHLKQRRNRTPHLSLDDLDFHAEHSPELVELISHITPRRDVGLAELQKRLNEAMLKLSDEHRAVVILHDIQGLPHDEIATIMHCNPGTVRSRLHYARQQLQGWLADFLK
ncbi:MAG TPA: sigma-70 family RNA polymerase sigma factor [Verrucomicrobiota bacterium]|nr:RNA polymerase subunit sigma-24 [Verrucomicrobiales bacterium]HRI14906.1 sigma-70 family RNA polymerase sigma factor [Verrucomicrobiota bacterium]